MISLQKKRGLHNYATFFQALKVTCVVIQRRSGGTCCSSVRFLYFWPLAYSNMVLGAMF